MIRVIAPAPMIGAHLVIVDNALPAATAITLDRFLAEKNALDFFLNECPGTTLTPGDRCALFQTWRA
jgi:hypothetical protein